MSQLRKGQHVICRYNGEDNGDVIIGKITSIRRGGEILIENFLLPGGKPSVKSTEVFLKRNLVVPMLVVEDLWNGYKTNCAQMSEKEARAILRKEAVEAGHQFKDKQPTVKIPRLTKAEQKKREMQEIGKAFEEQLSLPKVVPLVGPEGTSLKERWEAYLHTVVVNAEIQIASFLRMEEHLHPLVQTSEELLKELHELQGHMATTRNKVFKLTFPVNKAKTA